MLHSIVHKGKIELLISTHLNKITVATCTNKYRGVVAIHHSLLNRKTRFHGLHHHNKKSLWELNTINLRINNSNSINQVKIQLREGKQWTKMNLLCMNISSGQTKTNPKTPIQNQWKEISMSIEIKHKNNWIQMLNGTKVKHLFKQICNKIRICQLQVRKAQWSNLLLKSKTKILSST
jgi:hypothetical protein